MPKPYFYHGIEETSLSLQEHPASFIEDTACSLVSQTLAEAVAEEIVDNVLNNALNLVCPCRGTLSVEECSNIGQVQMDGYGFGDLCISQVNDFNNPLIIDHTELIANTCCNIISEIEKASVITKQEEKNTSTQEKLHNPIEDDDHTREAQELMNYFTEINNTGLLGSEISNESVPNENEHNEIIEGVKRAVQDIINGVLDTPTRDGKGDCAVDDSLPLFDVTVEARNIIHADKSVNDRMINAAENNTIIYETGDDTICNTMNDTFVIKMGKVPIVYETEQVNEGDIGITENCVAKELEPQFSTCNLKQTGSRYFFPEVSLWDEEDEVEVRVIYHEDDDFQDIKSKELMNYCTKLEKDVEYLKSDFIEDASDIVNEIVDKAMCCASQKNETEEKQLSHSADMIQETLDIIAVTKTQDKSQTAIVKQFGDDLNALTSSIERPERKLVMSGGIGDVKVCCGIADNQATVMQEIPCCSCANKCSLDNDVPDNANNLMDPKNKTKQKSKKWKLGCRVRKFFASAIRRNQSATNTL